MQFTISSLVRSDSKTLHCYHAYTQLTGEFKKAYPDAKIVAVDEAIKKKAKEGLEFDGGVCVCLFLLPY